jgi:hypothetical protein
VARRGSLGLEARAVGGAQIDAHLVGLGRPPHAVLPSEDHIRIIERAISEARVVLSIRG